MSDFSTTPVLDISRLLFAILSLYLSQFQHPIGHNFHSIISLSGINNTEPLQARTRHVPGLSECEVRLQAVHLGPHSLRADGEHALHSGDLTLERDRRVGGLGNARVEAADQVVAAFAAAEEGLGGDIEEA